MSRITPALLREYLIYDPATGVFRWRKARSNVAAGAVAGTDRGDYVLIRFLREQHYAHRLAVFWMTGDWPRAEVDHKDRNGLNNAWGNLRQATRAENEANKDVRADSSSGIRGVMYLSWGRWRATIKGRVIGYFQTKDEAAAARAREEVKVFGDFASAPLRHPRKAQ